ncbi:LON peptidase substrate-binding domain-containing protein [Mycobacterium kubicae]|nr:LON peptidase substrate-binding domain-containing protein [Mycobacterium kubicae]MCV7095091.1 LON peptidase substrate-binding domain-containing protein [Mycobacterium kubicae]ORV97144.1 ATP-dependent protease [Mycobacterium kubicae]QNI14599.1 ATP-dependent protease [Mycobacterium kubicae]QPI40522.1 LON peptidase substrate-binding domain-containing protein [Mycobacterium kubicae]
MFPLESVLLPGDDLPLRIFEPRYTALVRDCLDSDDPRFGVVLISRGREVGGGEGRCEVGALAKIAECIDAGAGRYVLSCRVGERIRVRDWLPDDPYPRAAVWAWPDERGTSPVTGAQLRDVEDRVLALFERIADVRGVELPPREVLLGEPPPGDAGKWLYALASRVPMGPADRYAVLAAPSAADRLVALLEAVDSVTAMVEFELSD